MMTLRSLRDDDIPVMSNLFIEKDIEWMAVRDRDDLRVPATLEQYRNEFIVIEVDRQIVGALTLSFTDYFGFWIAQPYRRRGLADAALTKFFASLPKINLFAGCWHDNLISQKLLQRHGFDFTHRQYIGFRGVRRLALWYRRAPS